MKPLTIPKLEVTQIPRGLKNGEIGSLEQLAPAICKALSAYPHFVVVNGYPALEDRTNLINLSQAVCALGSGQSVLDRGSQNQVKVSFTQVRIDRTKVITSGKVTQYSRTHLPLAPHTDSSYMIRPHELVAFQCIVADKMGGESIMIPVEDILSQIDSEVLGLLRDSVFPFSNNLYPIISGTTGDEQIRYYRSQIDRTLEAEALSLSDKYRAAIESLDTVLQQSAQLIQFPLQPGQILLMHNRKVLHGRTGLSPESDRLLYRVRLHVDSFELDSFKSGSRTQTGNYTPASKIVSSHGQSSNEELTPAKTPPFLAQELKGLPRFEELIKLNCHPRELPPHHAIQLKIYGQFFLSRGQFAAAAQAFLTCLKISPDDYESGLALSSIADARGDYKAARAIMNQVARRHPLIWEGQPDPQKPTLLRIRGIEGSAYRIVQKADGTYKNLLRGGHFSIQDLIHRKQYNLMILNILENNIDELQDIPKCDLLLNTIACPDLKRMSLLAAARFVDRYPNIPVINDPRRVLETTRERNALRLNMIPGVSFPKTERLRWDGISLDAIAREIFGLGFVFPFIVRQVGSQTGSSVQLVNNQQELCCHLQNSPADREYYIIQFQDCRNARNVYNKTRVFFIDGNFYPVANLFNNSWNVHSGDRYNVMDTNQWMQDEERSFLNDPVSYLGTENLDKLFKIRDFVGLDFFGIDLTILRDGTLFIFELNAAMRHNFDHAKNFPYTEPHLRRISNAFNTMIQNRLHKKASK
ncbi:MAG: TauD/TfdA family dioxygenase [Xenococcus sp. MO_188.B8]|nr:TauD/TfdA family dioxygenase [Xenococcus sp. MO_188.B8]